MEVTQLLIDALSMDGTVRKRAEERLYQFEEQNLAGFLLSLAGEVANDEKPLDSRKIAGLVLKGALDPKTKHSKYEIVHRWLALDKLTKSHIRSCLLKTLSSPIPNVRSIGSRVIAKVAGIDLPRNQWPELLVSLLSNIHQLPAHVKQANLETLGYLCEEVSPDVVDQELVNVILTAVVQGMAEENNEVRLVATRALSMAVGFGQANFNDMERDNILRLVCRATMSHEVRIRQAAFECLASVASTFYERLAHHMQQILTITFKAVREDDEAIALLAIELWSSICVKEIDTGGEFTKQALPKLVPLLLETLLKQEENQDLDEGDWNIAKASGTCLGLVARVVGDDIVPHVMPFIEDNISKPEWREPEAATYVLGSILEVPSANELMTNAMLTFVVNTLRDTPSKHLKDTTAWTLGRILEFLHGSTIETSIVTQANCEQIIEVLVQTMKDEPNVAEKACRALYFLAKGYEEIGPNCPLTPFFEKITLSLLAIADSEHGGDAAEEALHELLGRSTQKYFTFNPSG